LCGANLAGTIHQLGNFAQYVAVGDPVVHLDEDYYRKVAERCLRMAEFSERAQSAVSLREIATDYLDIAAEITNARKNPVQLRAGRLELLVTETQRAGLVATIYTNIKRAIQSIMIVVGAILVGILVFTALILATGPAGVSITSYTQVECMRREVVSLKWPRDLFDSKRSLDTLQRLCSWRNMRHSDTTSGVIILVRGWLRLASFAASPIATLQAGQWQSKGRRTEGVALSRPSWSLTPHRGA
jgi:hypothetical protein